jgi:hypothetical protein
MIRTLFLSIAFVQALSQSAFADGVFMVVKGDVKVEKSDKKIVPAKVGMKVNQSDTIIAGKDSRAKVVMQDKNVLNISPDTKILIEKYQFDESKDQKNVTLNVLYGKVRSTVNQKYDGEKNKFQVKTPSAVAGVRGTDFLTQFSQSSHQAKFVTFEGKVEVGTPGPGGTIRNSVFVNPGQSTSMNKGALRPQAPAAIPKQELAKIENETKAEPGKSDRLPTSDSSDKPEKEKKSDKSTDEKKDAAKDNEKKSGNKTDAKSEGKADKSADSKAGPGRDDAGKREPTSSEGGNSGQSGPKPLSGPDSGPTADSGTVAPPPPPPPPPPPLVVTQPPPMPVFTPAPIPTIPPDVKTRLNINVTFPNK